MLKIFKKDHSTDNSIKYLLQTSDLNFIETVYIPKKDSINFCISCQIGCVNKCNHCATGKLDFIRDLLSEEIVDQVKVIIDDLNIVNKQISILFMGMGEPFLNFLNVIDSINLFKKMDITEENLTISTIGIVPQIYNFSNLMLNAKLALSIHAPSDYLRNKIVPLNKIFSLKEIIKAAHYYVNKTKKKIIIEYTIIDSINDQIENAIALKDLLTGLNYEIHLIPFNESPNVSFKSPSDKRIIAFNNYFINNNSSIKIKRSYAIDVFGGCGQLYFNNNMKGN